MNLRPLASVALALAASFPSLVSAAPSPEPTTAPIPLVAPVVKPLKGNVPASGLMQFKPRFPKTPQHTEFVVEVNRKGQVSRVRSGKRSQDRNFDAITYGNAKQVFIREPNGDAISGLYRLTYDYNPATQRVTRNVALLHAGGVNPDALGIVDVLAERNRQAQLKAEKSKK